MGTERETRCPYCDGTGDVHGLDGQWRGECTECPAAVTHAFKNFHSNLCKRFGYSHDDVDWRRDLVSLVEHIAKMVAQAAPVPSADAVDARWLKAVQEAYGWLWHVNNEPMAPVPMWSPEQAAYEARKNLRDLLTTEQRGEAINAVSALLRNKAEASAATRQAAAAKSTEDAPPITRCQCNRDGDCVHAQCPQLRDGEPARTGRSCPLLPWDEDAE